MNNAKAEPLPQFRRCIACGHFGMTPLAQRSDGIVELRCDECGMDVLGVYKVARQLADAAAGRRWHWWVTMTLNALVPQNRLEEALARFDCAGVQWRRWRGLGCHTHPAFKDLPAPDLEVTRESSPRVTGIPCHTKLTARQVAAVCACLVDAA